MFWKFNLSSSSQVEKLLEKEDVTLQELLEEDEVLQECKAQNQRLLLFLTQQSCMLELLSLITHEPPADQEEKVRYRYANVACELLTCDVSLINDKVGGDESLLNTLYSFLEQPPPLNPLLASFFSKTIGNLITHKAEQVISFLKSKEDFLGQVLKHFDTSAMMDLVLRLVSSVEPWLNEEHLIQRLIDLIHPHTDSERQANASQALSDIIRLSRDQAREKSEMCIVYGTQVIDLGVEKTSTVNNSILMGIQPHLHHYQHLLMLTSMGILEEPFGSARLHASRLIAALLNTRAPRMHEELCHHDIINLLLVEHCVSAILSQTSQNGKPDGTPDSDQILLETPNSDKSHMFARCDLIKHLLKDCRLIQRILDAWDENERTQEAGGMRRGYMGHLTRIANTVVQNAERDQEQTYITQLLNELPEDYKIRWEQFVNETLAETNRKNTADLVFSDYQIQQMTANFVDQFGLNDDEFGEDGSISATFDRITEINFNLVDEGVSPSIFESRRKERVRPFDEAEEEEDIWEDKEINYAMQVKARSRFGVVTNAQKSDGCSGSVQRSLGSPDVQWFQEVKSNPGSNQKQDVLGGQPVLRTTSTVEISQALPWIQVPVCGAARVAPSARVRRKGGQRLVTSSPSADSGARSSSPEDSQNKDKGQDEDSAGSSTCVWSVCGARKAPLVASDSSSSASDSEEEEEKHSSSTESGKLISDAEGKGTGAMATDVTIVSSQLSQEQKGGSSSNGLV
ncbi:hypothetical protein DNTS_024797 [Danionella cerebrum]|uniref:Protein phosphatase 6, regulatory subunit 2b n=1 Tax=Danionella cerebrum TaxID=2873325 RepID=A0A553MZP6_9TELE|nr:hypothetical protein DNTS_024797 [Danionella translucida]